MYHVSAQGVDERMINVHYLISSSIFTARPNHGPVYGSVVQTTSSPRSHDLENQTGKGCQPQTADWRLSANLDADQYGPVTGPYRPKTNNLRADRDFGISVSTRTVRTQLKSTAFVWDVA